MKKPHCCHITANFHNRGNLLASAFDALAYSGVALLIGLTMKQQKWVEDIERWR
jgi:hypothetical protein